MRVAIVIDALMRAGAERQAIYTARGLAEKGCEVELIQYYRTDDDYDVSAGGARVVFLPKRGQYIRFVLRLASHLRRGRFDVVHGFKGNACVYAGLAARLAGCPVILGGYRQEYDDAGAMRLAHRLMDRIQDGWIVNSKAVAASLVRAVGADPARCYVVDNAIDADAVRSSLSPAEARRRLSLDADAPVVAMVARFRPQKNHGLFLEAAARVHAVRPDVRFLLVGDGPERAGIESRGHAMGLGACLRFLGDRSDVPDLLVAADVAILTSNYEGVSNVLMEAMCMGIPVLSTSYAGADELISDGETGALVPCRDPDAFAVRLLALLADPALREQLGTGGRRAIAARYSLGAMTEALLRVYGERLGSSPRVHRDA